jgi:hypothetical protein
MEARLPKRRLLERANVRKGSSSAGVAAGTGVGEAGVLSGVRAIGFVARTAGRKAGPPEPGLETGASGSVLGAGAVDGLRAVVGGPAASVLASPVVDLKGGGGVMGSTGRFLALKKILGQGIAIKPYGPCPMGVNWGDTWFHFTHAKHV